MMHSQHSTQAFNNTLHSATGPALQTLRASVNFGPKRAACCTDRQRLAQSDLLKFQRCLAPQVAMTYADLLMKLEKIRKVCKTTKLKLPQITVIGDQSSGKSSLLAEISGIPFPVDSKICTRCPIVVHTCKHDAASYIINEKEVTEDLVRETIERLQSEIKDSKVSDVPIKIEARGPAMMDLVFVDLPGIIHTKEGSTEVLDMIKAQIEADESLILVITRATQDDENAKALQLAEDADPTGDRTLRILTKFDVFDSPEKRAQAIAIINRGVGALKPHAVICRPNGADYDDKKERELLSNMADQGIFSLTERLPSLLCRRIQTNLPHLKKTIRCARIKSETIIDQIGARELNHMEVLFKIQKVIKSRNFDLSDCLEDAERKIRLATFDKTDVCVSDSDRAAECTDTPVQSTRFLKQMVDKLYKNDKFQPIFFQGTETFNACLAEIVDLWRPIIDELKENIMARLTGFLPSFDSVSKTLQSNVEDSWNEHVHHLMSRFATRLNEILKKECMWSTSNHYITAKYNENILLPEEMRQAICDKITEDLYSQYDPSKRCRIVNANLHTVKSCLKKAIDEVVEARETEHAHKSLGEQQKERILAAVRANTAAAWKTMVDNIHYAIRSEINDGKDRWVNTILFQIEEASEDAHTQMQRKTHLKTIDEMRECEQILKSI